MHRWMRTNGAVRELTENDFGTACMRLRRAPQEPASRAGLISQKPLNVVSIA